MEKHISFEQAILDDKTHIIPHPGADQSSQKGPKGCWIWEKQRVFETFAERKFARENTTLLGHFWESHFDRIFTTLSKTRIFAIFNLAVKTQQKSKPSPGQFWPKAWKSKPLLCVIYRVFRKDAIIYTRKRQKRSIFNSDVKTRQI